MADRQFIAAAAEALYTAHCARLARPQGPPALPPVESATLRAGASPRRRQLPTNHLMTREAEPARRSHVGPDLEHHLVAVAQGQHPGIAAAEVAVHVNPNGSGEAEQAGGAERPTPDGEETREPSG